MYLHIFIITFAAWISFSIPHADAMPEDVIMKRKAAMEFFQRDRRDLNHECYTECCNWEEVREHYQHDVPAAIKYWNTYKSHGGCKGR